MEINPLKHLHLPKSKNSTGDVVLLFPDGFVMVICVSKSSNFGDICLSDIVNVAIPRSHRREAVENFDPTKHPMEVDTDNFLPRKYALPTILVSQRKFSTRKEKKMNNIYANKKD